MKQTQIRQTQIRQAQIRQTQSRQNRIQPKQTRPDRKTLGQPAHILLSTLILCGLAASLGVSTAGAIDLPTTQIIDRQFPIFIWCPVETRGGSLVEFTAASSSVSITFTVANFAESSFVRNRIDNVTVVEKTTYDSNNAAVTNFLQCYEGDPGAPAFTIPDPENISDVAFVDLFDTDPAGDGSRNWEGGVFEPSSTAPRETQTGSQETGGSWAIGSEGDGDVSLSTIVTVSGLQMGVDYVVVGWWYAESRGQLTITVEDAGAVATGAESWGTVKARYEAP